MLLGGIPSSEVNMAVQKFKHAEQAYLDWKSENPSGYVVNAADPRKSKGEKVHYRPSVRLHLASCSALKRGRGGPGEYTEKGFYKICSTDANEIKQWCIQNIEFEDGEEINWNYATCRTCCPI